MEEIVLKEYKADCDIERLGEKMMQLQIQPHLFREFNNLVK